MKHLIEKQTKGKGKTKKSQRRTVYSYQKEYISLYSKHGKKKRIGKFKSYYRVLEYINKRFNNPEPDDIRLKNYDIIRTKS